MFSRIVSNMVKTFTVIPCKVVVNYGTEVTMSGAGAPVIVTG